MDRPARRRRSLAAVLVAAALVVVTPGAPEAVAAPEVRDVGRAAGLPRLVGDGYSIDPHDVNHDRWIDLLMGRHGAAAQLFMNEPVAVPTTGFASTGFALAYKFIDTIHDRPDRHGCAWGDVNLDGRDDLLHEGCTRRHREEMERALDPASRRNLR
jgi:hypothetical protein